MKEQDKTQQQLSDLPNKKFRAMIVKMIQEVIRSFFSKENI